MGIADGILGGGENLSMDVHVVNAASGIFGGLQTPTRGALLDEYHRRVADGAAPADGHEITPTGEANPASTSWRDHAALALQYEKIKFL